MFAVKKYIIHIITNVFMLFYPHELKQDFLLNTTHHNYCRSYLNEEFNLRGPGHLSFSVSVFFSLFC